MDINKKPQKLIDDTLSSQTYTEALLGITTGGGKDATL